MSSTVQPGMIVIVRSVFWLPDDNSAMIAFTSIDGDRL